MTALFIMFICLWCYSQHEEIEELKERINDLEEK